MTSHFRKLRALEDASTNPGSSAEGLGTAAAFFRKARTKAGVHAQPRPGFGDEAFFDLTSLHVLAGDAYLIISAVVSKDGMNTADDESALEALARKALARLR